MDGASGKDSSCSAKSDIFFSAPPSRSVVATTSSTVTGAALTVLAISATSTDMAKPSARTVLTNMAVSSTCLPGRPGRSAGPGRAAGRDVEVRCQVTGPGEPSTAGTPRWGNLRLPRGPCCLICRWPCGADRVEPLREPIVAPSAADLLSFDFADGTGAAGSPRYRAVWPTRCSICLRSTRAGGLRKSCIRLDDEILGNGGVQRKVFAPVRRIRQSSRRNSAASCCRRS